MAEQIALRPITTGDLPILFEQQREPEAIWMAAFTAKDPSDWEAFSAHLAKVLTDPGVTSGLSWRTNRSLHLVSRMVWRAGGQLWAG